MRTLYFALAIYVAALAAVDTIAYNGRYSTAVLNAATQQLYRAQVEVKNFLDRAGISSVAVARP